jgi:uncharacterized protein YndB with AHSA1/START domain
MVDVADQVDAVRRTVGRQTVDGHPVHVLSLALETDADAGELWAAVTSAKRLQQWFLPVTGDLRAGGRYALEGNASGTIEACDPPRSFAATWEFGGDTSRIAVTVEAVDDQRSRLTLVHRTDADDPTWAEHGPGATGIGWDLSLLGLVLYLAAGGATDPAEAAWAGEDDGLRFLHLSGEAWHDADVAAGTDPADARLRADRTIGAYTAPQDDEG